MTIQEAIEQLESLRSSIRYSIDPTDREDIFTYDAEAISIAIQIMKKAALLEQETANIETHIHN